MTGHRAPNYDTMSSWTAPILSPEERSRSSNEGDNQPFAHPEDYQAWRIRNALPHHARPRPGNVYTYNDWLAESSNHQGVYHRDTYSNGLNHAGPSNHAHPLYTHPAARSPPPPIGRYIPPARRNFASGVTSYQNKYNLEGGISRERTASAPPAQPYGGISNPHPENYEALSLLSRRAKVREAESTAQSNPPTTFQITLPSEEYIHLSQQPATLDPPIMKPKLLVLDLNGALVYRKKNATHGKSALPRPYLGAFLEYLFLPEPKLEEDGSTPLRPWEVFVWSSAQPHNVRNMVEATFGKRWIEGIWQEEGESRDERIRTGEGRLKDVWARDKMGLDSSEYGRKVQTVKDLRKVIQYFSDCQEQGDGSLPYDESSVILLDDSPLKAIHQPWSQIVIPEYDQTQQIESRVAVGFIESNQDLNPPGLDRILLGVIGILEELRMVENVPSWIRSGGLMCSRNDQEIHLEDEFEEKELKLEDLPSHEGFGHWYTDSIVFEHWKNKGLEALKRKGIKADIGPIAREDPIRQREISGSTTWPNTRRNSPTPSSNADTSRSWRRQERGYSPSVPVGEGNVNDQDTLPPIGVNGDVPGGKTSNLKVKKAKERHGKLKLKPVDSWSTFKAKDVALYLQDVADRPSPLSSLQRQHLLRAINILEDLGPEEQWDDDGDHLAGEKGFQGEMCLNCTLRAGKKENERLKRVADEWVKKTGMASKPKGNPRSAAETTAPTAAKGKKKKKKLKAVPPSDIQEIQDIQESGNSSANEAQIEDITGNTAADPDFEMEATANGEIEYQGVFARTPRAAKLAAIERMNERVLRIGMDETAQQPRNDLIPKPLKPEVQSRQREEQLCSITRKTVSLGLLENMLYEWSQSKDHDNPRNSNYLKPVFNKRDKLRDELSTKRQKLLNMGISGQDIEEFVKEKRKHPDFLPKLTKLHRQFIMKFQLSTERVLDIQESGEKRKPFVGEYFDYFPVGGGNISQKRGKKRKQVEVDGAGGDIYVDVEGRGSWVTPRYVNGGEQKKWRQEKVVLDGISLPTRPLI